MYLLLKASFVSKGAIQSKKKKYVGKFPYLGLKFPYFFSYFV